ncbi:unnamed protein product [Closterium sp. Yama58-4]|nr:unnamed protein product [Closterium sp. Yama58-4]
MSRCCISALTPSLFPCAISQLLPSGLLFRPRFPSLHPCVLRRRSRRGCGAAFGGRRGQLRAVMHVEASFSRERGLADVAHRFQATRLYIGQVKRSVLWSRLSALSLAPHSAHHPSPPTLLSALPPACLLIEARGTRRLSTHSHPLSASATPNALPESRSLPQGGLSARSSRAAGSFLDGARRVVGRRSAGAEAAIVGEGVEWGVVGGVAARQGGVERGFGGATGGNGGSARW